MGAMIEINTVMDARVMGEASKGEATSNTGTREDPFRELKVDLRLK